MPAEPHEQDRRAAFSATCPTPRNEDIQVEGQFGSTRIRQPISPSRNGQASVMWSFRAVDAQDIVAKHKPEPTQSEDGGETQEAPGLTVLSCKVCGMPTINICNGCQALGYCELEHQKKVSAVLRPHIV